MAYTDRAGNRGGARTISILTRMIKRPNTIKMKRLLQALIECDRGDRQHLKELQEDAKRVLGLDTGDVPVKKPRKRAAARSR